MKTNMCNRDDISVFLRLSFGYAGKAASAIHRCFFFTFDVAFGYPSVMRAKLQLHMKNTTANNINVSPKPALGTERPETSVFPSVILRLLRPVLHPAVFSYEPCATHTRNMDRGSTHETSTKHRKHVNRNTDRVSFGYPSVMQVKVKV